MKFHSPTERNPMTDCRPDGPRRLKSCVGVARCVCAVTSCETSYIYTRETESIETTRKRHKNENILRRRECSNKT